MSESSLSKSFTDGCSRKTMNWQELYEERAAIKQYHGNMSKAQAEKEARQEINRMKRDYETGRQIENLENRETQAKGS